MARPSKPRPARDAARMRREQVFPTLPPAPPPTPEPPVPLRQASPPGVQRTPRPSMAVRAPQEAFIGRVEGYSGHREMVLVGVERGSLWRGDLVRIRGAGFDAELPVERLLLAGRNTPLALPGDVAGIRLALPQGSHGSHEPPFHARVFVVRDPYGPQAGAPLKWLFDA